MQIKCSHLCSKVSQANPLVFLLLLIASLLLLSFLQFLVSPLSLVLLATLLLLVTLLRLASQLLLPHLLLPASFCCWRPWCFCSCSLWYSCCRGCPYCFNVPAFAGILMLLAYLRPTVHGLKFSALVGVPALFNYLWTICKKSGQNLTLKT